MLIERRIAEVSMLERMLGVGEVKWRWTMSNAGEHDDARRQFVGSISSLALART